MKRTILILVLIVLLGHSLICYASENDTNINGIIENQKNNLKINDFIEEAKNYSSKMLDNEEIDKIFLNALSGNFENQSFIQKVVKVLFEEFLDSIKSIGLIIIVVLIHSILKSITDGLETTSVSEFVYYITYILIVTIIMKNFAGIINLIQNSIQNLVAFVNCLFPILLTLLITSGGITSAATIEPIIMLIITIVSNIITKVIIPLTLTTVALNIISNISAKAQINKLSNFINSTVIWALSIMLTIFVGITSLEGTISKRSR